MAYKTILAQSNMSNTPQPRKTSNALQPLSKTKPTRRHIKQEGFFRFLDLPPELRNAVYHLAFAKLSPLRIAITKKGIPPTFKNIRGNRYVNTLASRQTNEFALLFVNRQIHRESIELAFATTCFEFADYHAIYMFLDQVVQDAKYLTKISIPNASCDVITRLLTDLKNGEWRDVRARNWALALRPVLLEMRKDRSKSGKVLGGVRLCEDVEKDAGEGIKTKKVLFLQEFRRVASKYLKED